MKTCCIIGPREVAEEKADAMTLSILAHTSQLLKNEGVTDFVCADEPSFQTALKMLRGFEPQARINFYPSDKKTADNVRAMIDDSDICLCWNCAQEDLDYAKSKGLRIIDIKADDWRNMIC